VAIVVFAVWESSEGVLAMLRACWRVGDDGNEREQWRPAGVTGDDLLGLPSSGRGTVRPGCGHVMRRWVTSRMRWRGRVTRERQGSSASGSG
jgi:hypothetical protein